jgi:ABC transporter substrate binding protein (PQQ-dependent alcohol dehydrogenase system)
MRRTLAAVAILGALGDAMPAVAQDAPLLEIHIGYLGEHIVQKVPSSFMEAPAPDDGLAGAKLGVEEDNTTGRFTKQNFTLDPAIVEGEGDATAAFKKLVETGHRLIIADLPAAALLAVADLPEAKSVTLFNVAARDDKLRAEDCRANVLHVATSRAMLADALVQYLVLKRWRNVLLVVGPNDGDKAYADAVERSLAKFGAKLVERKPWTFDPGARRTDTGHFQISAEVARFTQGISYDVLVVADEANAFGNDILYRTTEPRPVAGTQGLVPVTWARPYEEQGATQVQNRFRRENNGRWMSERDYAAYTAARAVGEAAARVRSGDADALVNFIRSDKFALASFKGAKLSFRPWDGQLRQRILLADESSLISVSPQPGFLHQVSELDTLGIDQPESKCKIAK